MQGKKGQQKAGILRPEKAANGTSLNQQGGDRIARLPFGIIRNGWLALAGHIESFKIRSAK